MNELTLQPFDYNNVEIRCRQDSFYCLTDMWIATGSNPNKRPVDWLGQLQTKEFIKTLEDNNFHEVTHSHYVESVRGTKDAGTWAHYQIAIAYAKYLDPGFHIYVNEVFKRYKTGELNLNPYSYQIPKTYADALIQLGNEIKQRELAEKKALLLEASHTQLQGVIEKQLPKVAMADDFINCKNAIKIEEFAQPFKCGKVGRNNMFKFMRQQGLLKEENSPYQKYIDLKWFKVIKKTAKKNGSKFSYNLTLITGKGQFEVSKLWNKHCEQQILQFKG